MIKYFFIALILTAIFGNFTFAQVMLPSRREAEQRLLEQEIERTRADLARMKELYEREERGRRSPQGSVPIPVPIPAPARSLSGRSFPGYLQVDPPIYGRRRNLRPSISPWFDSVWTRFWGAFNR